MARMLRIFLLVCVLMTSGAVAQVRIRILGSMQDGGLPHAGCSCVRCEACAGGRAPPRHVASLALIVEGGSGGKPRVFLFDATPDLREQLRMLRDVRPGTAAGVDRKPVDGIFLTHAHMGHYLGLAHLGYEALHAPGIAVWCTPRMAAFLRANAPWSRLVELGEIEVHEVDPGKEVDLGGALVRSVPVPHRDELSDTVAYEISVGGRRVLYMPDCDPWHRWRDRAEALIERADIAILDATFFSAGELPGRDISRIGHPLVVDTITMLADRVRQGKVRVILTHMNHTNPLIEEGSDARRRAGEAGFEIAREGREIVLGGSGGEGERRP